MKLKFLVGLVLLCLLQALAACGGDQKATPTLVPTLPPAGPGAPTATVEVGPAPGATGAGEPTPTAAGGEASTPPEPTAVSSPQPTPAYRTSFESFGCAFAVPAEQEIECGYLAVPEDRGNPDGPYIRLAVAILRHPSGAPEPDPIVYLAGGPGRGVLETIGSSYETVFQPLFAANRDLILFDQRGVGLSKPQLDCPAFETLSLDLLDQEIKGKRLVEQEVQVLTLKTLLICGQELGQGADLSAYHTAASAADVNDLRLTLGYEQINLWGVSYGSRLALEVMRRYPQAVRAAALDSVYPPEADPYLEGPANLRWALDLLFARCAADDACNTRYPRLERVFSDTVIELNRRPALITVAHPGTGESHDVLLSGDLWVGFLFQALYHADLWPDLPQLIYQSNQGDYRTLESVAGHLIANLEAVNVGMHVSAQCHDEVPFSRREQLEAALAQHPELAGFYRESVWYGGMYQVCDEWGAGAADPDQNQPVTSPVPALIMAGEYDPVTPPAWGGQAAANLENGYYFEYPGVGHGTSLAHPCPQSMMSAFFLDPVTAPDAACIATMAQP